MDTSYTPLQNPDLSVLDPSTVGVDSTITTQTINSQLSPFSLDSNNTLNINKVASFASDITVGGVINNTDLQNKLSNKSSKISTAPATIVLGQSSDIVYFVNENSVSYPLVSSNDISFSRNNNNILLNITQVFQGSLCIVVKPLLNSLKLYHFVGLDISIVQLRAVSKSNIYRDGLRDHQSHGRSSECRQYERCL
jgi:hypothetical protein